MKKLFVLTFIIGSVMGSCSVEESAAPPENLELNTFILSASFQDLGVDMSDLNLEAYQKTQTKSGRAALYIPFNTEPNKHVIGILSEESGDYFSSLVEISELTDSEDLRNSLYNKEFNGKFKYTTSDDVVEFSLVNSKVVSIKGLASIGSKEVKPKCRDASAILACAGRNIDAMGPFSYAFCILDIVLCVSVEMADCWYAGCPYTYVPVD